MLYNRYDRYHHDYQKKMWMNLVKIVPNSSTAYLFMPIEDKAILVGIEGVICKRM